jgi:archaellin
LTVNCIADKQTKSVNFFQDEANPNADNFPIKVTADNKNTIKNKELKDFLDSLDFERVKVKTSDGDIYYLFDKKTGISLV